MKILFLSRWFPYPQNNGSKLRVYHLLQGLNQQHEVHLVCFSDAPEKDAANAAHTGCASVRTVQWHEFDPNSPRAIAGLFNLKPRSLIDTYSKEMEKEIRRALREQAFDLVIVSEWVMNAYQHCYAGHPALLEDIEVGVPYGQYRDAVAPFERLRYGLTWLKQRRFIKQLLASNQICTVVSTQEREILSSIAPENPPIHVISNGVDLKSYEQIAEQPVPNTLIFSGSFRYKPNYEAMVWFLEHVYPLVQAEIPDVCLTITGDSAGLPIPQRAGVVQTGFVPDVRPYIARAWASIVPLLVGGGTRLKILEAMALRTPVISTHKGAEGLAGTHKTHLLIADSPEAFARETVLLLRDKAMRSAMTANAYHLVRDTYDWRVIMPEFLSVVEQAAGKGQPYPTGQKGIKTV